MDMYDNNERKKYYEKIAQKESSGVDPQFTESWTNGFVEGCIYKDFHQNCITCSNHSSNTKLMQTREELEDLNLLYQKDEKEIANLQSELEKKRLAIKNRNTRIKNLRANLTGTQNALEKRNKELAEAKEIIDIFLDFESTCQERGVYISNEYRKKARQFLGEEE